ncbi:hypothetical protein BDQ12DRAFT_727773 [Crucibulum laeve]|uniref:Uncharacterized protein n=1 Tax=Crucibulum laeve TaxID=68775 RepID=A0A5C3LK17_9AGAR|nr:hypothetical protein BDQ12DRAFT_727773 [Crucibulum laeve]
MTNAQTPTYSRFQAILTARPGTHPVLPPLPTPKYSYDTWDGILQNRKRKREIHDAGPSNIDKAIQRARENEKANQRSMEKGSNSLAHREAHRQDLMNALQERFKENSEVDFHGCYEMIDPGVTHKQRIQTITHEIWKATGYRFTVKDHPHVKDGHKTRFWCSQDEAHRSKSSRNAPKPRLLSGGEAMAKTRYPCRSRLLISSRDAAMPGIRLITIRMHHHVAHEPYVDSSLPPEVAQSIWEGFGWVEQPNGSVHAPIPDNHASGSQQNHLPSPPDDDSDNSPVGEFQQVDLPLPDPSSAFDSPSQSQPQTHTHAHIHPHSPAHEEPPPIDPTIFQQRLRTHIRNIRDFCDGLEYQLQFNDCRMLDMLENEGGPFLRLVEECLEKEGRLVSPNSVEQEVFAASPTFMKGSSAGVGPSAVPNGGIMRIGFDR